ncbi:MAG TPA: hypothetical protein VL527_13835 [Dongiaceae bacterium]|nr:hypothetical protein [Dongiaceae bacterium]
MVQQPVVNSAAPATPKVIRHSDNMGKQWAGAGAASKPFREPEPGNGKRLACLFIFTNQPLRPDFPAIAIAAVAKGFLPFGARVITPPGNFWRRINPGNLCGQDSSFDNHFQTQRRGMAGNGGHGLRGGHQHFVAVIHPHRYQFFVRNPKLKTQQ